MTAFYAALFLISAGTLMYEVVLTRLLSVISFYYLAFVSVSAAMFGMTVGALFVQLRPDLFEGVQLSRRLVQGSFAMAVSMLPTLLTLLAVPVDVSLSLQTLYSFVLFTVIIAVPFFFSGITVCLSLTRAPFQIGRIYFVDLMGAAAGCLASVGILKLLDGPSAILAISALLFLSAAAYASYAGSAKYYKRALVGVVLMLGLTGLNTATLYGIQPIWVKGQIDRRLNLLAEVWNPIAKVRATRPTLGPPLMWGQSPRMPHFDIESIYLNIDNDAATQILRYEGNRKNLDFLQYDVTSLAYQIRHSGSAAVIGLGGGRDALAASTNGFDRIVGIEINSAIVDLATRRLNWFAGLSQVPGLEIHTDDGRSYLARTNEKFDVIQASMVDTWASASVGAMTLSESSLYTVEAWRIFYQHLKPSGLITFTRWYKTPNSSHEVSQTFRMFAVGWATLLSEGVSNPADHIALLGSGYVATLLLSNEPLSQQDLQRLRSIAEEKDFVVLFLPGQAPTVPELNAIAATRSADDLRRVSRNAIYDFTPVYDSAPFFFNSLRPQKLLAAVRATDCGGNLVALSFLLCFTAAAVILVGLTILLPLKARMQRQATRIRMGEITYFVAIGLGFMLVEISMMQQLSLLLGHPIYSLTVVLGGLICSAGIGSLASEKLRLNSGLVSRAPSFAAALLVLAYSAVVLSAIHNYVLWNIWQRVILALALIAPCGFLMGFCFPVGLRWVRSLGEQQNLPWMWALNGAASVLGSFLAMFISIETSIRTCVVAGAVCYGLAAMALPRHAPLEAESITAE